MQRVIPGLWIGDYQAAQDHDLLEDNSIQCVVSAMRQEYAAHPSIELHKVLVDDDDRTNILEHFVHTADFIHAALQRHQGVLVHCQAGVSRSTTLVAAYLMLKHGMTVEQALEKIKAARSHVEPSESFMSQLEMFERCNCEWDPVNWPEQRRFLMSFAQAQIMEGVSPSIVLAYYPSPASTPENRNGSAIFSMTPVASEQVSPPPSPRKGPTTSSSTASASSPVGTLPPAHPDLLPGLAAPPARKRLTPRRVEVEEQTEAKQADPKPATVEKIGSREKVVVTGRRVRCKMCRRELAAREHIIAHEIGKGQQAFAPNKRDMAAYRAEQHQRHANQSQAPTLTSSLRPPLQPNPASTSATTQPPTNPLAALRISQPLPGIRVSVPRGAPVARPQPMARPTPVAPAPAVATRDEELAASHSGPAPSPAVAAVPDVAVEDSVGTAAQPSSPAPPPAATTLLDSPLLPSRTCSSYFVEPLSWMSPVLETGVLAGKIVCPNQKCGAKLGNFDWAGSQCSCGAWVCPGFALSVSRVDEVTA
ncbi:hypothetical protein JCM11641_005875 [Rhodosporidiobolus odoratus]